VTEVETSTAPVETRTQVPQPTVPERQLSQSALVAARIARTLAPTSVLDLSESFTLCDELGLLGISADHAPTTDTAGSGPAVKAGRWDVITCIGILEELTPEHAESLLEQMCQRADTVIVSCGPAAYFAPLNAAVRPAAAWAAGFAERGFYRRVDLDIEFAGPWTVVFERSAPLPRELVYRYEQSLALTQAELRGRGASRNNRVASGAGERATSELEAEIADLKHRLLISRDYAIGQEAELARAQADSEEVRQLLDDVYASNTWRLGSVVARPLNKLKRALGSRA
jgi:hypothetical protein